MPATLSLSQMTSVEVERTPFYPFNMVDDRMEISSEHGGNATDDIDIDIDIDIDYTPIQTDDDMLDDVESQMEFTQEPRLVSDDIMVDDEPLSFPMEEAHDDEDEQFEDVPEENIDVPDIGAFGSGPLHSDNAYHGYSNLDAEESLPDLTDQFESNDIGYIFKDVNHGVNPMEPLHIEDNVATSSFAAQRSQLFQSGSLVDANTFPNTLRNSTEEDVNWTSTNRSSGHIMPQEEAKDFVVEFEDQNAAGALEPTAHHEVQVTEESAAEQIFNEQSVEHTDIDQTTDHTGIDQAVDGQTRSEELLNEGIVSGETASNEDVDKEQRFQVDIEATYSDIIVTYRDTQYALFSSSEDDDSDSYFLRDRSITQAPVAMFLESLRGILEAEIGDDEELCVAIDVLRLEFGENSPNIDNVTFEEIIYLHQQLLRNDGIESPEPLHFTLGTRPEFAKRFAKLLTSTHEGRGLSELTPRDEEIHIHDDNHTPAHMDEECDTDQNEHKISASDGNSLVLEYRAHLGHSGHGPGNDFTAVSQEWKTGEQGQPIQPKDEGEKDGRVPENLTNGTSPAPTNSVSVPEPREVHLQQVFEGSNVVHGVQPHEEDDLVDYGDNDDNNTKPTALPSGSQNAGYRARDEELRRRSPTRAAEDEAIEEASARDNFDEATFVTSREAEQAEAEQAEAEQAEAEQAEAEQAEAQELSHETNIDEIDYEDETKAVDDYPHKICEQQEHATGDDASAPNGSGEVDDYYTRSDELGGNYDEEYDLENGADNETHGEDEWQDFAITSEALTVNTSAHGDFASLISNDASPHKEISAESVTVSADTLEADEIEYDDNDMPTAEESASDYQQSHDYSVKSAEGDERDEIDYDDDDVGIAPQSPKASSTKSTSSSTPAKRQRSESFSEVAPGEASQEAKRARS